MPFGQEGYARTKLLGFRKPARFCQAGYKPFPFFSLLGSRASVESASMGSSISKRPKPVATPTLAGLAVTWLATADRPEERVIYPWTLVGITRGDGSRAAELYQEDGSRLERDGKKVIAWLGYHEGRVAIRAQERAFRSAYNAGTLCFGEKYAIDKGGVVAALLVLAFAAYVACVLPRILAAAGRDWELPGHWAWLDLLLASMGFLFVLGAGWIGVLVLKTSWPKIREATWDSHGALAELSDGNSIRVSWQEFEWIRTRLKFGIRRRSLVVYRVIEESLFPERVARRRRDSNWKLVAIRCAIYWLVIALLASLTIERENIRRMVLAVSGAGLIGLPFLLWVEPALTPRRRRSNQTFWQRLRQPKT